MFGDSLLAVVDDELGVEELGFEELADPVVPSSGDLVVIAMSDAFWHR